MTEEKKGITGIQAVNAVLVDLIILGEKIAKDGVDVTDLKYLPEIESALKKAYELIQSKPDLVGEAKDIDFAEGIILATDLYNSIKKVMA